jgi:hypothetical protein
VSTSGASVPRLSLMALALLTACAAHSVPVLSDYAVMPDYAPDRLQRLAGRTVKVEVHGIRRWRARLPGDTHC